jgi:hypothetical protein
MRYFGKIKGVGFGIYRNKGLFVYPRDKGK